MMRHHPWPGSAASRCCCALLLALLCNPAQAQIFTDSLSSGTNWTIQQDADTSFAFGYDYSQDGLPAAPNGGDSIGLKFEVNNNEPGEIAEIGAFYENSAITGQYTFRVDMWLNWAPDAGAVGTGTTEFIGAAVGHDASAPGPFGATFIVSGEGGAASTDYRLYKDETHLQSESGSYALGSEAGARNNTNPLIAEAFPEIDIATAVPTQGSSGTQPAGGAGYQWMTLNVEVDTAAIGPSGATTDPGFARFSMKSATSGKVLEIGTVDNSNDADGSLGPIPMDGVIGLLMSDIFSSVAVAPAYSFGIFDNVQVLDGLVPLVPDTPVGLGGDYNDDGKVDAADYTVWRDAFGDAESLPNDDTPGVGADDYDRWVAAYGQTSAEPSAATSAPEPAAALLLLGASLGLARRARHRR